MLARLFLWRHEGFEVATWKCSVPNATLTVKMLCFSASIMELLFSKKETDLVKKAKE